MSETLTALTDALIQKLEQEVVLILNTMDAETGYPSSSAISWAIPVNEKTIRFAVDARSRIVNNIRQHPKVSVVFFGEGTVNAVYGEAKIVVEALEEVPFKLTCVDIHVEAVRDAMFYGARIIAEPEYEKTYDKRAAEKLDNQVFSAMKKA